MRPRLIHPVPVEIQQLLRASTEVDPDFREEVENVARGPVVVVPGQIEWHSDERHRSNKLGAETAGEGYIVFRTDDLRRLGIASLHRDDQIVAIGVGEKRVETNLYVVRLKYEGHYPRLAGPAFVKAYFKDRSAVKAHGGGMQ